MRAANTRERILDAAERVLRERGAVWATTKEIARAAGVAEGTLYIYFKSKNELYLAVVHERLPGFIQAVVSLPGRVGSATVSENLAEVLRAALPFYHASIPMSSSLFYDPQLLAEHRALLAERGGGPHRGNEMVAKYLRGEQERGRISSDANPRALADLLLGACLQRVYWDLIIDDDLPPVEDNERFIQNLLTTLAPLLAPEARD